MLLATARSGVRNYMGDTPALQALRFDNMERTRQFLIPVECESKGTSCNNNNKHCIVQQSLLNTFWKYRKSKPLPKMSL